MIAADSVLDGFRRLIESAQGSVEYHAQGTMRRFVHDLIRAMDRRGMRNSDLATAIGSSSAYVTKILRGDINFTLETMTKLVMAIGGRLEVRILDMAAAKPAPKRASSR